MTPEEFAAQTGLSLEEAEMVLAARARKNAQPDLMECRGRLEQALAALRRAEAKVGVKPYEESK